MINVNFDLLGAYRYVDGREFFDLPGDQIIRISLSFEALRHESSACGALVPEGYDPASLGASRQSVLAAFFVATDGLDQFLHDPAPRDYLDRGQPVLVQFEAFDDYLRFRSMVTALPLSDDEEARLDHAEQARCDEADEARRYREYEPTWDDGQ
jgi:hypothetical protein